MRLVNKPDIGGEKLTLSKGYMHTNGGDGSPSLSDATTELPTGTCDMPVACLDTRDKKGHKAEILALTPTCSFSESIARGP